MVIAPSNGQPPIPCGGTIPQPCTPVPLPVNWTNVGATIGCIGGMGPESTEPIIPPPPPGIRPRDPVPDPGLPTGSGPAESPVEIIPFLIDVAHCIWNVWTE